MMLLLFVVAERSAFRRGVLRQDQDELVCSVGSRSSSDGPVGKPSASGDVDDHAVFAGVAGRTPVRRGRTGGDPVPVLLHGTHGCAPADLDALLEAVAAAEECPALSVWVEDHGPQARIEVAVSEPGALRSAHCVWISP